MKHEVVELVIHLLVIEC